MNWRSELNRLWDRKPIDIELQLQAYLYRIKNMIDNTGTYLVTSDLSVDMDECDYDPMLIAFFDSNLENIIIPDLIVNITNDNKVWEFYRGEFDTESMDLSEDV